MAPAIELDALTVRFGRRTILDRLQATVSGRAIGLLGPNGAGKSTLIQTVLGFHPPAAGGARVLGLDVRKEQREVRRRVGYMPENDAFIAGMSAVRFVRMMAELSGLPPTAALERAHQALFYVGLGEARYRKLETFSLGMKQLIKLAQALVHGPKLLLLDEPTNGLDPPARSRMLKLIREIRDSGDVKLVLSSHLLPDVEACCDQVLILKQGRIAAYCDLEEQRRVNKAFVLLEVEGESDEKVQSFLGAARKLGCEHAPARHGAIKMVLPTGFEARELFIVARDNGVTIQHLEPKRDSLADIFLKAMDQDQPLQQVAGAGA